MRLVPFHTNGKPPSYFIIAGLVFTPVTVPYLKSEYGKVRRFTSLCSSGLPNDLVLFISSQLRVCKPKEYDFDAPVRLLEKMVHSMAESVDQQVVVLGHVLAAEINIGYEDIINTQVAGCVVGVRGPRGRPVARLLPMSRCCNTQVKTVNGQVINNLQDLVRIVDNCRDPFLNIDLDYAQKVRG